MPGSYSTVQVTQYLNDVLPGSWIGHYGPQKWPWPESPRLCYWDFMKYNVFKSQASVEELRKTILEVSGTCYVWTCYEE